MYFKPRIILKFNILYLRKIQKLLWYFDVSVLCNSPPYDGHMSSRNM